MQPEVAKKPYFGWVIVVASVITFGIAVGIPYYNLPFFYDYFQKAYGWRLDQITLGFPLAALLTIWVGPLLIPRFSPRKLVLAGTALTAVALCGFGLMGSAIWFYFLLWFIYTVGYLFSGPIPHQILVSHWFKKMRGRAMGIVYVGVGLFGALGAKLVKPLTEAYGFHAALMVLGLFMFAAWPIALFVLRDKPGEMGLFPDGASEPPPDLHIAPLPYMTLLKSWPFWLLMIGSIASIGSIGVINFHMKFVFRDEGFTKLLFDPETHRLLGGAIVGTHAGDLIAEICLAVELGADATDIGRTILPHPTLPETIGMAAEAFEGVCTDLLPATRK